MLESNLIRESHLTQPDQWEQTIATDQGIISETVLDGVNGFIVPKQNPEAIAEKICLLLDNEPLRRQMGRASRQRFVENYTIEHWADSLARVFRDVLEES